MRVNDLQERINQTVNKSNDFGRIGWGSRLSEGLTLNDRARRVQDFKGVEISQKEICQKYVLTADWLKISSHVTQLLI